MRHSVLLLLRTLSFIGGLSLIWIALFLYESKQGVIQNRLENLWIRLDDLQRSFISRHTTFMHIMASSTSAALDQVFGKKLFSARFIGTSTCFSLASIYFFTTFTAFRSLGPRVAAANAVLSAGYLFLASARRDVENSKWIRVWTVILITSIPLTIVVMSIFFWTPESTQSAMSLLLTLELMLPGTLIGLVIAVVSDVLFVALTRWILRLSSNSKSFLMMTITLFLNCFLALSLFLVPLYYQSRFVRYMVHGTTIEFNHLYFFFLNLSLVYAYPMAVYSNLYTAIVSTMFIFLALSMLLHRILWPVMERPVYVMQDLGIVRRKKTLVAIGLGLMAFAFGYMPEFLKILEKLAP